HLTDAEPHDPKRPLWKEFKKEQHFFDNSFAAFLDHIKKKSGNIPIELVLNGDIFDYDSVMSLPESNEMKISHTEKITGLDSQEEKSLYKTKIILKQHFIFINALKTFIKDGHKVIFIIGNHDIEFYWPSTQKEIISSLTETREEESRVT